MTIVETIKTSWKSWLVAALRGAWEAVKNAALPALIGASVASATGCSSLTPSTRSQSMSVYGIGIPAIAVITSSQQETDSDGDDHNMPTQNNPVDYNK